MIQIGDKNIELLLWGVLESRNHGQIARTGQKSARNTPLGWTPAMYINYL